MEVLAPVNLIQLANHMRGVQIMARPQPSFAKPAGNLPDLRHINGQESAKRALEIAAVSGHTLLITRVFSKHSKTLQITEI